MNTETQSNWNFEKTIAIIFILDKKFFFHLLIMFFNFNILIKKPKFILYLTCKVCHQICLINIILNLSLKKIKNSYFYE